jgi:molecular chaperone DnaK
MIEGIFLIIMYIHFSFFNSIIMAKIIGIDLGTTNSCVAFMEGGQAKVIPNAEGGNTTPSVVANKKGETIVGMPARRQAVTNPANTIYSAKRFIGRKFSEVTNELKSVPFKVTEGPDGGCLIEWDGKGVRPEEISAKVLEKLKEDAEKFLGQKVTEAVITVPAYFNDSERQATINAGKIAGLDVKRIVNEPTAAALAYGADRNKDQKIAVYDFGGGTFDISILEIGAEGTFEVLATNGDTHLGGDDFDQKIFEYVMAEFQKETGIDLRKDPMAVQRVRSASEKAKIELSSSTSTDINEPFIAINDGVPSNLHLTLTRAKFEELIADLVERSLEPCRKVMKDSGLQANQIHEVILVGGSTRVPMIKAKVEQFFGKKPNESVHPDEAVALGAAIQAGIIQGDVKDVLLLDVTPLSLGIETLGGVMTRMIERNTTIPTSKSQVYSTAADNQDSVEIHIVQGEREMASDNKSLGRFLLSGIASAPRGVPQIEVTFDIDASGVLHVTAKDKGTGKEQKITVQGSTGMSDDEVDKLVKEAEANRDADKKKKESIEARNHGDSLVYQSEKTLDENKGKYEEADGETARSALERLKQVLADANSTKEEIEESTKTLSDVMMKIGQAIYSHAGDPEKSDEPKKNDDGSIEAEVEEK